MVQVKDIMAVMEGIAPRKLAESWDKPGLAVGDPDHEVKKILVALDVTKEVIAEAAEMGADMIITHHPMLLFQKFDSITTETSVGSKIISLIQNNIAAFSAHTNLDIAKGGTNDVLAELIGLQDLTYLEETWAEDLKKIAVFVPVTHAEAVRKAMCDAGVGEIGNYTCCTFGAPGESTFLPMEGSNPFLGEQGKLERVEEVRLETLVPASQAANVIAAMKAAHPYEEVAYDVYAVEQRYKKEGIGRMGVLPVPLAFADFARMLKEKLGLDSIRLTGDAHKMIQKVALCTGSGAEFILPAYYAGADAYLTADIKFHEAQKAVETGICVADVTHYASEVLIVPVIQKALEQAAAEKGWALEVVCSKVNGQTFWAL